MSKKNIFKVGDKVILLDGRIGIIEEQDTKSDYYFWVKTYTYDGRDTYFKLFHKDMKPKQ